MIISLPKFTKFLLLARGNQLCWFRSSHHAYSIAQIALIINIYRTYFLFLF